MANLRQRADDNGLVTGHSGMETSLGGAHCGKQEGRLLRIPHVANGFQTARHSRRGPYAAVRRAYAAAGTGPGLVTGESSENGCACALLFF